MRIAEMVIVCSWSSLGIVFPWYVWVVALFDICVRIADDHKIWLKEKHQTLVMENRALEEKKAALLEEIKRMDSLIEEEKKKK